jgi:hypothetical protein
MAWNKKPAARTGRACIAALVAVASSDARPWSIAPVPSRTKAPQELGIRSSPSEPIDQQFHPLGRFAVTEHFPQQGKSTQILRWQKRFLTPRAGAVDIDGRPDAPVREAAVQVQFHVAGALELFEDDLVAGRFRFAMKGKNQRIIREQIFRSAFRTITRRFSALHRIVLVF